MKQLTFYALDSWFFKESRPMESLGSSQMQSVFPPTPQTISGVIRSMIGTQANINWEAYRHGDGTQHDLGDLNLCEEIGNPQQGDIGKLKLKGTFIAHKQATLFPAPLALMKTDGDLARLEISTELYLTDLGNVQLPKMPGNVKGAKPLEKTWITQATYEAFLNGETPKIEKPHGDKEKTYINLHEFKDIIKTDPRLGIELTSETRSAKEGQLYQTNHLRLNDDYSLTSYFSGIQDELIPQKTGAQRFGAEGRIASFELKHQSIKIKAPQVTKKTQGLLLTLLTHANFDGDWLPKGFKQIAGKTEQTLWQGELVGITITIHAAILGKAVREGGWDIAQHQPKPAPQLIPAGSIYYVKTDIPYEEVIQILHLNYIGDENQLGRGLIACGLWNE